MAARSTAVRSAQARQAPAGVKRPPRRSELGVVDRRSLLERARRRQARVLVGLSGAVLAGALTIAAGGHALLVSEQYRADGLQASLASAIATQQSLQAERAYLETPSRILRLAKERFKMVTPAGVTYLPPVNPGETVAQAHRSKTARKSPVRSASR